MKRVFVLLVLLALGLTGCGSAEKRKKDKEAAQAKKEQAEAEANPDVDFQAFVGRLRKAVEARDMNTIAQMMTTDFAYVMGATDAEDRKGEGVFQYWDENGLWPELEGILSEKFVKKEDYMVAPPQFANPAVTTTAIARESSACRAVGSSSTSSTVHTASAIARRSARLACHRLSRA